MAHESRFILVLTPIADVAAVSRLARLLVESGAPDCLAWLERSGYGDEEE